MASTERRQDVRYSSARLFHKAEAPVLFLQLGELLRTAPRQRQTPHALISLVQPAHFAEIGHPLTTFMWCSHRNY